MQKVPVTDPTLMADWAVLLVDIPCAHVVQHWRHISTLAFYAVFCSRLKHKLVRLGLVAY